LLAQMQDHAWPPWIPLVQKEKTQGHGADKP
jgi:hypothetical protein